MSDIPLTDGVVAEFLFHLGQCTENRNTFDSMEDLFTDSMEDLFTVMELSNKIKKKKKIFV